MSGKGKVFGTTLVVAGAGVGYYLYNAGGDPKVAQKMAETDATKATNKVKSELPGSGKEAQKQGEELTARAGKSLDNAVADAKAKGKELDGKIGQKLDDLRKDANKSIDQFDKTVEKKAAEAKGGISSWFGGK